MKETKLPLPKATLVTGLLVYGLSAYAENSDEAVSSQERLNACLLAAIANAEPEQTVKGLRAQCQTSSVNRVKKRRTLEKSAANNPFAILPHKPNFLLPVTIADVRSEPYLDIPIGEKLDNYEPEVIVDYSHSWSLLGLPVENTYLSLNHQSNGQTGLLSRSWNRIILGLVFAQTDNVTWGLRTWYRVPEDEKLDPSAPEGDDNPNIERYFGYGELGGIWHLSDQHSLEFMLRNNLRSDNKGAVQLGYSFPINGKLQGYLEYFNGYGESLIYYNQHTQRLGLGFKLTNWL